MGVSSRISLSMAALYSEKHVELRQHNTEAAVDGEIDQRMSFGGILC